MTIAVIIFDHIIFRKVCFSIGRTALYVVILPHFRENFRNAKRFSNECKVIATFVYRDDDIVSMNFVFNKLFPKIIFFPCSKLLTLYLVVLARFLIQFSKPVVILTKALLKLVDLGCL